MDWSVYFSNINIHRGSLALARSLFCSNLCEMLVHFSGMGAVKCDLSNICCLSVDMCIRNPTSGTTKLEKMERKSTVSPIHEKYSKTYSLSLLN